MKAVKISDFKKFGCVNCGCEYCYADGYTGSSTVVICAECHEKFLIMNNSLKVSDIGFAKKSYNGFAIPVESMKNVSIPDFLGTIDFSNEEVKERLSNGIAILKDHYAYPIVGPHPREGIEKHPLVIPDIRPENNKGDFCYPRGVGYDLACFVKSKEAGERITEMINRVNHDYADKGFHCHLDYRESEPLWIQVKIDYPNKLRALELEELIEENDCIITEGLVRTAMNISFDEISEKYINKAYQKDSNRKKR